MAGRGPAPKAVEQRRRRNVPERGEWVDLEPLAEPVLPEPSEDWGGSVRRMWDGWRADPVTGQFGPAELASVWELAEEWMAMKHSEQRLRMDGLGLTLKGKRDLRFRLVESQPVASPRRSASVRHLKAV